MNISAPFVRRPVATTLLTIGATLVGNRGFSLLPVASLPQVGFPTINVSASLPGASPETMASTRGRAVGTPVHSHCRRHGDDLHQYDRRNQRHPFSLSSTRDIDGAARMCKPRSMPARPIFPQSADDPDTARSILPTAPF